MLRIHPPYLPILDKQDLNKLDSFMKRFGPSEGTGRREVLIRRTVLPLDHEETLDVHFKLYHYRNPSWRFWNRSSKAAVEFRNYGVLQKLGVACADPIACGEERDSLGRLRRAFILTRTIPDAVTLEEFMREQEHPSCEREGMESRRKLLREIVDAVRRVHEAGFFHHDLVWRNILVSPRRDAWLVSWIDCPRGGFIRWNCLRHRSRLRDLGSFDKSAARHCSRTDRLRCFLRYAGKKALDPASKKLIGQVLEYRRTRWPDDWPR